VKPSFGRIPQWPLGAFGHVAVAGPMTRTVRDAALMFSAMARHDLRDPSACPMIRATGAQGIEEGVAGLRVAIVRRFGFEPPLDADGEAALRRPPRAAGRQGAIVEEADPGLPDTRAIFSRVWGVALARLVGPRRRRSATCSTPASSRSRAAWASMTAADFLGAEALRSKPRMPWRASTSATTWC
jgi:aspartyl-tRNA(Asn)/glutamyl-tRNA(Gln) amidotransferase subunit A